MFLKDNSAEETKSCAYLTLLFLLSYPKITKK